MHVSLNTIFDTRAATTSSIWGYLGQASMDWDGEWGGKKRERHMWKRDKGGTDCSTDRGTWATKGRNRRSKKAQTEKEWVRDRWVERGRKWDKGGHGVPCCLWTLFALQEWARERTGGGAQRRETGSKRNQFNTTEIQKHFHLIKALQDKVVERGNGWGQQSVDSAAGERPVKVEQWLLQDVCLRTFHPLHRSLTLT